MREMISNERFIWSVFGWLFTSYWFCCQLLLVCINKTHERGLKNQFNSKAKTAYSVMVMVMVVAKSNLPLSLLANPVELSRIKSDQLESNQNKPI